jgi:hypothetical protein
MNYRKKPVEVEARYFDGTNANELIAWAHKDLNPAMNSIITETNGGIIVRTLEGSLFVPAHYWIIKGIAGEFYGCKPNIFEQTYEVVQ